MNQDTLKKHIVSLPSGPGVYIFKDGRKNLYIGKASNLKNRVGSYLPSQQAGLKTKDPRIRKMVETAQSLKFISTPSDIEALILESQLIKKFRPPFNIVMRDDKQYAFVGFTAEEYPKIFITHQPTKDRNFIGPFTEVGALKITLRYLRRIFPCCTCRQLHHNKCLNYHIGKCPGFCCIKIEVSDKEKDMYASNIKSIRKILSGRKNSLVKELKNNAEKSARNDDFEKAIELRDKTEKLERVFENARIIKNSNILKTHRSGLESLLKLSKPITRIEGYDISNIQGIHATGSMVTFIHGRPDKNFYRKFKIYTKQTPNDTAMLQEILERRFRHNEWPFPDLIIIDGGKGQVNAVIKTLKKLAIKIPIIGVSKNENHVGHQLITCLPAGRFPTRFKIIPLSKLSPVDKNLLLAIDSEAHRFAISYYRKLHRKFLR